jgi:hypothetical protein
MPSLADRNPWNQKYFLFLVKGIHGMNIRSTTPDDVATLAAIDLAAKRAAMPTIVWPRSEAEVRWYIGERLLPTGVVVAEVAGGVAALLLPGEHERAGVL